MIERLVLGTGAVAISFALIHIYGYRIRFLHITPRSYWLSLSGGISVAYVFVHILPELNEAQHTMELSVPLLTFVEHHIYLLALAGMVGFYGLERLAKQSRRQNIAEGDKDVTEPGVFWIHIASFTLYNLVIGYLLNYRESTSAHELVLYAGAIGTHLLVNDHGLYEHHKGLYRHWGRWLLAAAIIVGWVLANYITIPDVAVAGIFALLAGSIILNVLKEELPEERDSNYWMLALGAIIYALMLLAL